MEDCVGREWVMRVDPIDYVRLGVLLSGVPIISSLCIWNVLIEILSGATDCTSSIWSPCRNSHKNSIIVENSLFHPDFIHFRCLRIYVVSRNKISRTLLNRCSLDIRYVWLQS